MDEKELKRHGLAKTDVMAWEDWPGRWMFEEDALPGTLMPGVKERLFLMKEEACANVWDTLYGSVYPHPGFLSVAGRLFEGHERLKWNWNDFWQGDEAAFVPLLSAALPLDKDEPVRFMEPFSGHLCQLGRFPAVLGVFSV